MVYRVKWIAKLDDSVSDEDYQKKMTEHGMEMNPSHTAEQHAIKLAQQAHLKNEMDVGNLLARSSINTPDNREIHTVAIWKTKTAFLKSLKSPEVQKYRDLMKDSGWLTEMIDLN